MDMRTSTMNMGSMATATGATASATTSMTMSMGSMGGDCKISMLWNWYTLDACFISSSWHITSRGMFAGSCIGVILLVLSLECLRRASKEYDRYIVRQAQFKQQQQQSTEHVPEPHSDNGSVKIPALDASTAPTSSNARGIRPNIFQQLIRAVLHMLQFTVAYFIMLLAMYYNGYIIICIIIGAFLGAFVFSWEPISLLSDKRGEASYCCG